MTENGVLVEDCVEKVVDLIQTLRREMMVDYDKLLVITGKGEIPDGDFYDRRFDDLTDDCEVAVRQCFREIE